jgi:hypothetical protein
LSKQGFIIAYVIVEVVKDIAQKAGAKLGISPEKMDYVTRLATNKIMLASIATIVISSLVFSPFFPLFWIALTGAVVGIVVAVHQIDKTIEAEKKLLPTEPVSGSAGASTDSESAADPSNTFLSSILSFLFAP